MTCVDEPFLDGLVAAARARRLDATVFVLPRADGQYSDHATDVVALLEEAGLVVDYATDPTAAGVHAEKSAVLILPPLLVLFSDAATLAGAIEGIIYMIRWFTGKMELGKVSVDVTIQEGADGSSSRTVTIAGATAAEAEGLLREAGRLQLPK